jgi:hypothetical protein
MTVLVFKRTTAKPTTLTKGVVQFVAKNSSQADLYVGSNSNTPLQVVGSGSESEAGFYSCSVWKTIASSPSPSTVGVGVITNYDTQWVNDGQLNATTGVYTVPKTGLYRVAFSAMKQKNTTSAEVRLFKNGSAGVRAYADSSDTAEYKNLSFDVLGAFQANDKLDIRVTQGAVHANESCYLNIYKVR